MRPRVPHDDPAERTPPGLRRAALVADKPGDDQLLKVRGGHAFA
jgi:hypothetical protein